jgi:hypothetical protein
MADGSDLGRHCARHPVSQVVAFFPQGARFAVSRETILRRPKEDYARLLSTLSKDVDPYAGYFMEWFWSELFLGHRVPCTVPDKVTPISHSDAMRDLTQRFPKSVERQQVKYDGSARMLSGSG